LRNPIPETIQDLSRITTSLNGLPLIPYYGNTFSEGFGVLKLLFEVHELSSSASSCINSIGRYAFGGDMDIIDAGIAGFISETTDLSYNERLSFAEFLGGLGIPLTDIRKITESCDKHYKKCGNAYIYLREYNVAGENKVKAESIHPQNLCYLKPEVDDNSGVRTLVFSENFDQWSSYKFEYKFIRAFPEWSEGDGYRETVIHIGNFTSKSTWYGRPDSLSVLFEMIAEIKSGEQRMKVASADFVSTTILAFEQENFEIDGQGDESKEATAISKGKILRSAMTNSGDNPSALMTIDYPSGGQPPTPISINVNRDSAYMEKAKQISSDAIYSNFDWAKELTGATQSRGGIGSNMLKDMLSIKFTTTIQPLQDFWSSVWADIFKLYSDKPYTVKFPNLIENYNWNAEMETEDTTNAGSNDNEIETIEE